MNKQAYKKRALEARRFSNRATIQHQKYELAVTRLSFMDGSEPDRIIYSKHGLSSSNITEDYG
jgi:hypothetical protein